MNKRKSDNEIYWDYPISGLYRSKKIKDNKSNNYLKNKESNKVLMLFNDNKGSYYNKNSTKSNISLSGNFESNVSTFYYGILIVLLVFLMLFLTITVSKGAQPEYSNQLMIPLDSNVEKIIYKEIIEKDSNTEIFDVNVKLEINKIEFKRYRVKNNESVVQIAKKFKLNYDSIALSNGIKNFQSLKSGMILLIPNQNGRLVNVKNNDSIIRLSNKYGVSWKDIADANNLNDKNIKPGDKLFIPGSIMTDYERKLFNYKSERKKVDKTLNIKKSDNSILSWPIRGIITSGFGMRHDPFKKIYIFHSGLDIRGNEKDPVYSAGDGIISYIGWTNVFGNFILIKHSNDIVTLYGHLSSVEIKKGMSVKKGELIGRVGSTGRSTGPHLHFEVRKKNIPFDPIKMLNNSGEK